VPVPLDVDSSRPRTLEDDALRLEKTLSAFRFEPVLLTFDVVMPPKWCD